MVGSARYADNYTPSPQLPPPHKTSSYATANSGLFIPLSDLKPPAMVLTRVILLGL